MNVTFHAIAGIATAAALSFKPNDIKDSSISSAIIKCLAGFVIGISIHGVLDFLPHEYPFRPAFDVLLALSLLTAAFVLTQKQNRFLLTVCFLGQIFPDLVDLGPAILNKYFGLALLFSGKIFPWHWQKFSGSIYDGSRRIESMLYHATLLLSSGCLLYFKRKQFFNFGKVSR